MRDCQEEEVAFLRDILIGHECCDFLEVIPEFISKDWWQILFFKTNLRYSYKIIVFFVVVVVWERTLGIYYDCSVFK